MLYPFFLFIFNKKTMALIVTGSLAFSATKVTLINTTGTYDMTTNPTGYGNGQDFADYAHYAIIRKKNVNAAPDEILTLEPYDETLAVQHIGPRATDGWYEGVLLDVLVSVAGTYSIGDVLYNSGTLYQANTGGTNLPPHADWTVITDLELVEASANVIVTIVSSVTAYNADVYWSKKEALFAQQGRNGLTLEDKAQARQDKIYKKIQQVLVADQLGLDTDGEWIVLDLIEMGAV